MEIIHGILNAANQLTTKVNRLAKLKKEYF